MQKLFPDHPVHVGQRTIRTAIASVLCAAVYLLISRNPTFAVIGAIFGTGGDRTDSFRQGGNRFFGTLFGGLLGMGLFRLYLLLYPDGDFRPLMLVFLAVGVVVLILVCQKFWQGGVQPGGVVLSILLFNTPVETYLSYSVNRIIDTGIGVLFALLVGVLLPKAQLHRWMQKLHLKKAETLSTEVETI